MTIGPPQTPLAERLQRRRALNNLRRVMREQERQGGPPPLGFAAIAVVLLGAVLVGVLGQESGLSR
jgi:hypothetical protein